jgi:hypothetical protein
MNRLGFSTISLIVAIATTLLVVQWAGSSLITNLRHQRNFSDTAQMDIDMALLLNQIIQTGRLATTCAKRTLVGSQSLECTVSRGTPAVVRVVRFIKFDIEPAIRYENQNPDGSWRTINVYGNNGTTQGNGFLVQAFILCDPADMSDPATCPLLPPELNTKFTAHRLSSWPSVDISQRYFRFQFRVTRDGDSLLYTYQSGFWVRNPTLGSIVYLPGP